MFALGVTLIPAELRRTLAQPKNIVLGVITQYSVIPVLGFAAAMSGLLSPGMALGFVVAGGAPGALFAVRCILTTAGATRY